MTDGLGGLEFLKRLLEVADTTDGLEDTSLPPHTSSDNASEPSLNLPPRLEDTVSTSPRVITILNTVWNEMIYPGLPALPRPLKGVLRWMMGSKGGREVVGYWPEVERDGDEGSKQPQEGEGEMVDRLGCRTALVRLDPELIGRLRGLANEKSGEFDDLCICHRTGRMPIRNS
jgi:hypothetical protein